MTRHYGSRGGATERAPSGGVVSRPIAGLGKLGVGTHQLTVLSVVEAPLHRVVVLANPANHCHAEAVEWVPDWLVRGLAVVARVGFTPGYVVCRDVDRYQARAPADGMRPLTEWLPGPQAVFDACLEAGLAPATTCLEEVRADDLVFVPTLYCPPSRGGASATSGTAKR